MYSRSLLVLLEEMRYARIREMSTEDCLREVFGFKSFTLSNALLSVGRDRRMLSMDLSRLVAHGKLWAADCKPERVFRFK